MIFYSDEKAYKRSVTISTKPSLDEVQLVSSSSTSPPLKMSTQELSAPDKSKKRANKSLAENLHSNLKKSMPSKKVSKNSWNGPSLDDSFEASFVEIQRNYLSLNRKKINQIYKADDFATSSRMMRSQEVSRIKCHSQINHFYFSRIEPHAWIVVMKYSKGEENFISMFLIMLLCFNVYFKRKTID